MKLSIGLVTGGLKFSGDSLEKQSLGGSETAFLSVAKALAKRGHTVRAWCNTDAPSTHDGVDFLPIQTFDQCALNITFDVLIASRWPEFLTKPTRAHMRILWQHDTLTDKQRLMGSLWQTDEVWLLSDYHIEDYCGPEGSEPGEENPKVPELRPHIWKTNNGVDMELVNANRRDKVPGKVIYTSRPERGLYHLFQMLPELVKRVPNLKVHYANYTLDGMELPQHVVDCVRACDAFAKDHPEWVVKLGHLSKPQLYQEISSAELLLYPTSFPEISCITAMEAQACGTPIVSTDDFALSETVINHKTGVLIKGKPETKEYQEQFVAKAARLLQNNEVRASYAQRGIASIEERGYTWDAVAENWEKRILSLFVARKEREPEGVIKRLIFNGDLLTAQREVEARDVSSMRAVVADAMHAVDNPPAVDIAKAFPEQMEARQPCFQNVLKLLASTGAKPDKVLDISSGYAPFGYFAAKNIPDCQVVIQHEEPDVVGGIAQKLQLANVAVTESVQQDKTFDLVYFGNVLEKLHYPASFLADYLRGCMTPGGLVVCVTEFGPNATLLKNTSHTKFWNLDHPDFMAIFGPAGPISALFVPTDGVNTGYWIVLAQPDPEKLGVPDRSFIKDRPYRTIGCSMIVKNEEQNIVKCLKALRPWVDEIHVTDTGSRDTTMSLAGLYGADLVKQVAFDNFSQARNFSREGLNTDWYLWVDADEELLGGENLRKYTNGEIYEGVVVRQQHLMIDVPGTHDTPIRLLRNRPHYKFVGLIHEHCEDTSRGPFGYGIRPTIVAGDLDLAHYGYPSEQIRRRKCSNRNMLLLVRDIQENPGREINKLLFMRDCLNIVKWHIASGQPVNRNSIQHALLNACCAFFFKYFEDRKSKLYKMTDPMYQEALKILAAFGLPFETRPRPPFEVALSLRAQVGGPVQTENLQPDTRVFVDEDQFQAYMTYKLSELSVGVGAPADKYKEVLSKPRVTTPYLTDTDSAVELLKAGANVF